MNKYEMLGVIDEGAYGIVYKVRNKENNRTYAIKRFKDLTTNKTAEQLINREISMLKSLKSQYVVDMKEVFKNQGRMYIVFEYMGRNLLKLIEEGSLKQSDIIQISYEVLKALEYLHTKEIMHRDIKPQNILISDGKVKLCDFGFARPLPTDDKLPTDYVATRWYRSPELLLGTDYGKAADMWALGCMICEMIDGKPIFPGENEVDQLYLIQKTLGPLHPQQMACFKQTKRFEGLRFPSFSDNDSIRQRYSSRVCRKLIQLIEGCLKMDPKDRMTSEKALALPVFNGLREKRLSSQPKHYNPTNIYNSHSIQESLTHQMERQRGKSLIKLTKLQYLSTDLNYHKGDTERLVQMREKALNAYSQKVINFRKIPKF